MDKNASADPASASPSTSPKQSSTPYLRISDLGKQFGQFTALWDISLTIEEGEFVCFLGPSGCGKTTLLRAIAGLDYQSSGRIEQAGQDISALPPDQRDFGIVFQSYALFPNLSVIKNIGYGLANRKTPRATIQQRVRELLELVSLEDQGDKYPAQLSGGQQQRVALARALATSPGLLLLDEPLSALDAKVRAHLRHEVKALQRRLGVTTIMVTHDQEEALTMADRIVVMNQGVVEQIGSPIEIYRQPATPFVADFIGTMNFLPGTVKGPDKLTIGTFELNCEAHGFASGADVTVAIRPEGVIVHEGEECPLNGLQAQVGWMEFLGAYFRTELHVESIGNAKLLADFSINLVRRTGVEEGSLITVTLPGDRLCLFPHQG